MLKELEDWKTEVDENLKNQKNINEIIFSKISEQKLAYSPKEAAEKLANVKASTILSWIKSGKLQATKTGKNYLIPVESIKHLLTLKTI